MIKIVDDFIPKQYQDEIEKVLCGDTFLWTYQQCTYKSYNKFDDRICDVPFLGRKIADSSGGIPEYNLFKPLVYFFMEHTGLLVEDMLRAKANLLMPKNDKRWHPPHKDYTYNNAHTLLYYVNDSDGDTLIFEDESLEKYQTVTPKKGRALIFPSNRLHCGNNPSKNLRVALNFVILTK